MRLCHLLIALLFSLSAWSQIWDSLSVFSTKWSDSFVEWEFYDSLDAEDYSGVLEMRWIAQNDWSSWDFRFGDLTGDITTQWQEKYDEWLIQTGGQRVTLRTRWPGDFSEWRISEEDGNTLILSVVNPRRPEEWEVKYEDDLTFQIYTEFEGDLRSWLVYQKGRKVDKSTQMALIFAVIVATAPKI